MNENNENNCSVFVWVGLFLVVLSVGGACLVALMETAKITNGDIVIGVIALVMFGLSVVAFRQRN